MYLFSRQVTLQGSLRAMTAWATEITAAVNDINDIPVTLWTSSMGNPIGSMAWSARVESHAQLEAMTNALQSNDAYLDLVDKGQEFVSEPGQDSLRQFVTEPAAEPPQVAMITTATTANGQAANAMAWGVEVAEYVGTLTGNAPAFLSDSYGTFGQVTWIQGFADMASVDAVADATMADEGYVNLITSAADLFIAGSGQRSLATRLV